MLVSRALSRPVDHRHTAANRPGTSVSVLPPVRLARADRIAAREIADWILAAYTARLRG